MALGCYFHQTKGPFKKEAKCQEQIVITFPDMYGTLSIGNLGNLAWSELASKLHWLYTSAKEKWKEDKYLLSR